MSGKEPVRFRGKLTREDLDEARKLVSPKTRWPRVLFRNWYLVLLVGALVWTTLSAFSETLRPNRLATGLMWIAVVALASKVAYRVKTDKLRQLARLKVTWPDWFTLTEDGIESCGPGRATSFHPWENFKSWREGRRVILVQRERGKRAAVLPVANLSDAARQEVRQFLQSHIPPSSVSS
jgi:hypothetical protein